MLSRNVGIKEVGMFDLLRKIHDANKIGNLSEQQIKTIQANRLKMLLRYVLKNSEFYKNYYKKYGITHKRLDSITLKDLPPIDKKIMMDNYDEFVCCPGLKKKEIEKFISTPSNRGKRYKNNYHIIHTSGSTGEIGLFAYSSREWNTVKAMVLSRVAGMRWRFSRKTKIIFIGAVDGHYAGISLAQSVPKRLYKFMGVPINSPVSEIADIIDKFKPDIISGYSSGVYLLAKLQLNKKINITPEKIICSADPLTLEMRELIKQAFGHDPINFYASSEALSMAAQCVQRNGLHMFSDWHCLEVVDDKLTPVGTGKYGKLLLTNLYNYTQPLIRYQMNDEVILSPYRCECGSPFPVIKNIAGRAEEFLWFEKSDGDKEFIHPLIMAEFHVPGLTRLQVIQPGKNMLLIKAVIKGDAKRNIYLMEKRMREILANKDLEYSVNLKIEIVNEIKNDGKTGKFKFIIPYAIFKEGI
jgi:putative adenylate-forming enzyme